MTGGPDRDAAPNREHVETAVYWHCQLGSGNWEVATFQLR